MFTLHGHQRKINTGKFSPDGKWIATSAMENTARIWSAVDGIPWLKVTNNADTQSIVTSAVFSPDSQFLITTGRFHTAKIWLVDPLPLAERLKPRELSFEEKQRFEVDMLEVLVTELKKEINE